MKQIYIWIAVLFLFGVIAVFFLIPSKEEISYIRLKGKQYSAAELYYKKQYDEGVRTKDVIIALESLRLKEGNIEGAIQLMEDYVRENPHDYNALQLLASLYESNQQYDLYNQTLLKALKLKEDPRTLARLADITQDKVTDCAILRKLVESGLADSEAYLNLSSCYIQANDFEKALAVLQKRKQFFSAKVTASDLLFELWVANTLVLKGANPEVERQVIQTLITFLQQEKNRSQIYYVLSVIKEKYPQYLPMFMSSLESIIEKDPTLQALAIEVLIDQPQYKRETISRLLQLHKEKKLPPQSYNLLISFLIEEKNTPGLMQTLREMSPEQLDRQTIFDIAHFALVEKKPQLIKELREKLSKDYLNNNPSIGVALTIGSEDQHGEAQLKNLIKKEKLTLVERLYFFQLAFAAGYYDEALRIGQTLPPYYGLSQESLFDIAYAYILMGKVDEFIKLLQSARFPPDSAKTVLAKAAISVAKGQTSYALNVLRHKHPLPQRILVGFFQIGQTVKQYQFSLEVAEMLCRLYPSKLSEIYYAAALVDTGTSTTEGMRTLSEAYGKNPEDITIENIYYNAALTLAKRDSTQRLYLWKYMKEKELKESLDPKLARDFAYLNIELFKDYSEGKRLLKYIADRCAATNDDIQTLIYMWGPHPGCEERHWILCQAWNAASEKALFWLENLFYIGAYCDVLNYYETHLSKSPSGSFNKPNAIFIYLDTLAYLKRRRELKIAVERALTQLNEIKDLEALEGYAYVAYADPLRARIWEKVLALCPRYVNAWQHYGTALYDLKAYPAAEAAIQKFFALNSQERCSHALTYQSLYQFGSILEFKRCYNDACCYYMWALCEMARAKEYTIDVQQYQALTYDRLECYKNAIVLMREAYERASRDPDYKATFANILMDARVLKIMGCFLSRG